MREKYTCIFMICTMAAVFLLIPPTLGISKKVKPLPWGTNPPPYVLSQGSPGRVTVCNKGTSKAVQLHVLLLYCMY